MPLVLPLRANPSMASLDGARGAAARQASPLRALLLGLFGRLQRNGRRLAAAHQLHMLNDRLLRDMGVERDEIDSTIDGLLAKTDQPGRADDR
jgi:uncharacterized protein YjiS (DUF1127 family)